jgi:hypothetical protein
MSATSGTLASRAMVLKAAVLSVIGAADADDVGAGLFQLTDLLQRRGGVAGQGVGHRLDGDRRVAAHLDIADADLARLPALIMRQGRTWVWSAAMGVI